MSSRKQSDAIASTPDDAGNPGLSRRVVLAGTAAVAGLALVDTLADARPAAAAISWRYPFTQRSNISKWFSAVSPLHDAIDYIPGVNTPVYSCAPGRVIAIGTFSGSATTGLNTLGHYVKVQHADGYTTLYAHLVAGSIAVSMNQEISVSQLVGRVGQTGQASGPHLHLEVYKNGIAQDPAASPVFMNTRPLADPLNPYGDDMPTHFSTTRSTAVALQVFPATYVAEREWPRLPYSGTAADNLAELSATSSIFDVDGTFYISNLPAGGEVHVRLALWDKVTGVKSGLPSVAIVGTGSPGQIRAQYSASVSMNQATHRLTMQAFTTSPGVVLDSWSTTVLAW